MLVDLAQPWKPPIPLVEGQGNFGSRGNDPPASPYYTEARLSPAGQVALAAERGQIAPVPIGLINSNTHRQGTRPPFRPAAVIDAICQVLARPRLPAQQITALVGPPDFLPGCTVIGDLTAGHRTELGLHARVTVTDAADVRARVAEAAVPGLTPPGFTRDASRPVIVVDNFPPYANPDDILMSIDKRGREYALHARHPELGALTGLPIKNLRDLTACKQREGRQPHRTGRRNGSDHDPRSTEPDDLLGNRLPPKQECASKYSAGRLWVSASGPASPVLRWYGRRVGGLGPGLTSYSADAAGVVLRNDLSAGPRFLWHPPALPV